VEVHQETMLTFTETIISAHSPASLSWQGDLLIDWVEGGNTYALDGTTKSALRGYAYRFDSALVSVTGRYALLYERLGTKAVLLEAGKVVRELNRSFYHANVYEYPIQFGILPDGREILVHCPDDYSKLQIEEVATGRRLTERSDEREIDFFHSRIAFNPSGTRFVSAGWVWHPVDYLCLYKTEDVLANPLLLDTQGGLEWWTGGAEDLNSVAFCGDDQLLLVSHREIDAADEEQAERDQQPGASSLFSGALARYDLKTNTFLSAVLPEEAVGTVFAVGTEYALGLYDYPKLIHINSGKIVHRWPHLSTGKQTSSIIRHIEMPPPFAWDAENHRFAVADKQQISVVCIGGV
jgi:hypothetical protein